MILIHASLECHEQLYKTTQDLKAAQMVFLTHLKDKSPTVTVIILSSYILRYKYSINKLQFVKRDNELQLNCL